ncbi:hypothetical protein QR680_015960 [Steinernema hermaphroditum]|uniref:BTB domain-containing protein n=1 Tax=Steinernema hermaphroditum TaxID=289476 RepID=A0AA39H9K0_9BILA|nr:hypothetical protein QR680_015960 [Steinernema hermaphroditum]
MQAAYQIVGAGYAAPRPPPGFGIPYGIAPRYAPVQWVPVGPAGGMRLPGQQPCISSSNVVGVAPHRFGGQPLLGGGQITQQPQLGRGQSAQQQKSSVMPIGASTSRTVAYASVQNPTSVGTCSSPASVGIGTSPALAGNMRQNPGSSAVMADEQRNERPKYGQIFLLDTEEALYHRFSHPAAQSCDDDLVRDIEMIMRAVNPVVRSYKMMLEVEKEMIEASDGIDTVPQIRLLFNVNAPDQNRYNLPRVNEVAAVFVSPEGNDAPPPSKLVMHPRGMQFEELKITNPMCKRGLPHVHMLLILEEPYKLRTAEDVDSLVWAELPDPVQYPRLHEIVKKMMMHGPCGPGTRSPCMDKFKTRCAKRFPKEYSEETVLEENQIPRYRRRESAPSFEGRGGVKMDSRWVVPYNPYLMTKYNAHINVEICTSVRCVKYLFKYIYKGHDKANVFICESGAVETEQQRDVLDHDEVKNFTDARYVGAPEAAWRLKKYSMQDKSHHIERLAVHLQGEQLVYFRETEDNARVMERAEESETTLTAWFALNQRDPNARQYLYGDIPRHYTWNKKDKKWQPRQAHFNVIGHENGRENEVIYGTYSEAAKALGLLRDDDEWERCLRDAIIDQMPFQLRSLFVIILCECGPGDPADLYEKFKRELSEDWIFRTNNDDLGIQIAYADLERRLNLLGKSLAQFGMSAPEQTFEQLTVKRYATRSELVEFCMKSSELWPGFEQHRLSTNMRVQGDQEEFRQWLLALGNGDLPEVEEEIIEIPKEFVANGNLVSEIFGDAIAEGDWEEVGKRAILAPKNERCYRINQKVLDLMPGEEVKYKSIDAVHEDESSDTSLYNPVMFPTEFLNSVTHSSLPPHELKLKKNCTVMLLRNLNINEDANRACACWKHYRPIVPATCLLFGGFREVSIHSAEVSIHGDEESIHNFFVLKIEERIMTEFQIYTTDKDGNRVSVCRDTKDFTNQQGRGKFQVQREKMMVEYFPPGAKLTVEQADDSEFDSDEFEERHEYCLRSAMQDMFESERLADCTIKVDEKEFKAHRCILAQHSEVFRSMFGNESMLEAQKGEIDITDSKPEAVRAMLEFIYTGSTSLI